MSAYANILPEPAYENLKPVLLERLARIGAEMDAGQFISYLDPLMRQVLEQSFASAGAHEGTVWLLEKSGKDLVPGFNTGPNAELLMGGFKQPLGAGLISMVFASEQPFLENEVSKNSQQNKSLDSLLGTQTCAMIAVPFYLMQDCRGVVSCVQLKRPDSPDPVPTGFRPEHLAQIQRASAMLSRLIEFRLLGRIVGWLVE